MLTKLKKSGYLAGKEIIEKHLKSNGFYRIHEGKPDDAGETFFITAHGLKAGVFIKARIAHNSKKNVFTDKELQEVKSLAEEMKIEPWIVTVVLDNDNQVQSIRWGDLSKS